MSVTVPTSVDDSAKLFNVEAVAEKLGCSTRHVYRLSDAAKMPRPVKLGALVRWPKRVLEEWIDAGCPSCRKGTNR